MFDAIKLPAAAAAGAIFAGLAVFLWATWFAVPGARKEGREQIVAEQAAHRRAGWN